MKRLVANPPPDGSFIAEVLGDRFALPPWWHSVLRQPRHVVVAAYRRNGSAQARDVMVLYDLFMRGKP